MKKKSDDKDLDNDKLDFGDLDDLDKEGGMDFGDLEDIDDSRKPAKPGAIAAELGKEAGQGFLDSVARKSAEKALPESYKNNYYAAVDYADFAKETVETSKNKINKSLYKLGKEVKKIIPFQSKMLDGFLSKYESDFEEFKQQSVDQQRDASIASDLSSMFDKQLDIQKAMEAKRTAEETVDKKQRMAVDKVNLDVLTSIDTHVATQSAFTLQISKEYYRKSLELQYKTYFIQADMLKDMRDYYKGFSLQFEEIVKNTGLPDFVKLNTSERVSEILRTQFIQNTYKQMFSNSDYVKNVKQKMGNLIQEKVGTITDGIDNATDALGGINSAGEFGGGGGRVLGGILAGLGGNILGEKVADKLGGKIQDKIKDNKTINTGGNLLDMLANSPRTLFASLRNKTGKAAEEYADEDTPLRFLASKLFGGANELLSVTDPGIKKYEVKKSSILDHNKPAIFDNKVHRSISEVIPMYLSKILASNANLTSMYKTVNWQHLYDHKDEEEQVYDYENRKLSTKAEFKMAMEKSVFKDTNKSGKKLNVVANDINSLAIAAADKADNKDDLKVLKNKKAQKSFNDFMTLAGEKISADDFNYENVVTNYSKNPDLAEMVKNNPQLKKYLDILQKSDLSTKHVNLNEKMLDTKRVYPTLGIIELFKNTSKIVGSKNLNNIKGDIANKISEGWTRFISMSNTVLTIDNILDGQCFKYMSPEDIKICTPNLKIFLGQTKAIKAADDYHKDTQFEVLLGVVNESLLNNFEIDPEVFQKLYEYSPDLQGDGRLGVKNMIEGKLGIEDENMDFIDPSDLKELVRVRAGSIKELANAKTKLNIVDQIENSAFGQEAKKFTDIFNKFKQEIGGANNAKDAAKSVKSLFTSILRQSQETAAKTYASASAEFNKAFDKLNTLVKEVSEAKVPEIKASMVATADTYVAKIEELIRKEQESRQVTVAQLAEVSKTIQDNVDDPKTAKDLEKSLNRSLKFKDIEIKALQQFKGNLQASRNRLNAIDVQVPIDIIKFGQDARSAFEALVKEAKDTLDEIEAKSEESLAEAEA